MSERLKLPTFLVVTENPTVRVWMKKHFDEQFFIVDASTESETLEKMRNTDFDFIVVDSAFEDCDALQLCKKIRQLSISPIFFITGRLKKSYRAAALKSGVTDFLQEDLDAKELKACIETAKQALETRTKTSGISSRISKPPKEPS